MPIVRRRGSVPRRFARPKRQGAWHGVGPVQLTLTPTTATSVYLWSDLTSERLNMAGKGVHQRTLLWLGFSPGDQSVPFHFAASLNVHATDAGGNVPDDSIISPFSEAASLLERSPLDYAYALFNPNVGTSFAMNTNGTFTRDCKVKRRMDDTDSLLLTVEWQPYFGTPTGTQRVHVISRTYVTW